MEIRVPRWVQMVGLPVIIILLWLTLAVFAQALFIFAAAAVVALILDPLVRRLEWVKIPRFIGVFLVYLSLIAIIVIFLVLVIPPAIVQVEELIDNLPVYTEAVRDQYESWKSQLERLNLPLDVSSEADRIIDRIEEAVLDVSSRFVQISFNIVSLVTQFFLIIVVSIYMLLDAKRIGRNIRRLFPEDRQADANEFVERTRRSVSHWMQAQSLLSLLIGISVGIGIWLLGITGIWPEGTDYIIFFAAWAALTEFIPFVGPVLGALPPVIAAAFVSPWAALAVIVLFIVIQQVEGQVLVPNIMGQVVGIHPLVVIFAVLAGAQVKGIAGMLLTLPLLAMVREVVVFFKPRLRFERFVGGLTPFDDGPGSYERASSEPSGRPSVQAPENDAEGPAVPGEAER